MIENNARGISEDSDSDDDENSRGPRCPQCRATFSLQTMKRNFVLREVLQQAKASASQVVQPHANVRAAQVTQPDTHDPWAPCFSKSKGKGKNFGMITQKGGGYASALERQHGSAHPSLDRTTPMFRSLYIGGGVNGMTQGKGNVWASQVTQPDTHDPSASHFAKSKGKGKNFGMNTQKGGGYASAPERQHGSAHPPLDRTTSMFRSLYIGGGVNGITQGKGNGKAKGKDNGKANGKGGRRGYDKSLSKKMSRFLRYDVYPFKEPSTGFAKVSQLASDLGCGEYEVRLVVNNSFKVNEARFEIVEREDGSYIRAVSRRT